MTENLDPVLPINDDQNMPENENTPEKEAVDKQTEETVGKLTEEAIDEQTEDAPDQQPEEVIDQQPEEAVDQQADEIADKEHTDEAVSEQEEVAGDEPEETVEEQTDGTPKPAALHDEQLMSIDEILEKLKNLASQENVPARAEVDVLKHAFYKIRSNEIEAQKAKFTEEGNDVENFVATVDPAEDVLKTYLSEIKEKRAGLVAAEERKKEDNYHRRLEIIESFKNLTESTEDFNKLYKEFKELQQAWNDTKPVPASKEKELWKSYQYYTEIFYDLIKINNEFRDYDFKKNLELKTAICEAVEKLIDEPDEVSAFHQLQNFHQQWREIGPVAKDLREDLWTRFKTASTAINKKYQSHFESLKGKEEENLEQKTAIIEILKTIDYDVLTSMKAWDEKSKEVIDIQAKWKTIGFVPRKVNTQIFEEFRALCDKFFEKKSEFFKGMKDEMEKNLEMKKALVERAKAMKDSTDWKKTTDDMVAIQKEWKTIGPVPRKYSDTVWKEFVSACDYFFEQKKKNFSSQKDEEVANLAAKKDIIEQIKLIDTSLDASEAIEKVRELADKWHSIGFVPFKEKDRIYKEFHEAVDSHYDRLKIDKTERRLDAFKSNLDDITKSDNAKRKLLRERDRMLHIYTKLKTDLQTYENNMNFLSISTKGAGNLLKDVNNKIEDLKNEMSLIEKKIESIEDSIEELD